MDIASVFDWFAQESTSAAEQTDEPRQREIWMKLSELWGATAQRCRDEQSCGQGRSLSQHRMIGGARVREVARYEPSLPFFSAVQSSRCRRQLTAQEGPHLREDLERRERFRRCRCHCLDCLCRS